MTPRELIRQTAAAFRSAGVPDPEVDAALLLAHVTGQAPLLLRTDDWTALPSDALSAFDALARRRLTREPLQYILQSQSFLGREFYVDRRVLIPRPETELLAERAMDCLRQKGPGAAALDLCCGSGCIAVSMALAVPDAEVHACDLSGDALAVTRRNAEALGAAVTLHQGDLLDAVDNLFFDVIVSNPPYIPTADCEALQQEVLLEPTMALDGGRDGLDFYRRIAQGAAARMKPDAVLLLEVGYDQAGAVQRLLLEAGFHHVQAHEDYQHIQRMIEAHH